MLRSYVPLAIFVLSLLSSCQPRFEAEITVPEIDAHIRYMASEELAGRYPGTDEDMLLLNYIGKAYKMAGLELYDKTGIQYFDIVTDIELGDDNAFRLGGEELQVGEDFIPLSFSASAGSQAGLVFAGYGFQIDQEAVKWDDYAGLDVNGRWVMILRGVPGKQDAGSPYMNYSEDRSKALLASDLGAAGIILVSGERFDAGDALMELKGRQHALPVPVVQLSREAANRILDKAGQDSIQQLEKRLGESLAPLSFETDLQPELFVNLQPKKMQTGNTLAILEGSDPVLKEEYVVLGAHHDHLGMGGEGTSSRAPDTVAVHYGADDNASGVAAVLEIAESMAVSSPRRSMAFTSFGAEEMGLIGSRYLVENFPVDLDRIQAMINLDMVGRLNEDRQLQIGGVGTSPGLEALLDSINQSYQFSLKFSREGYGPSDHASFYAKDVPVLFISTGAHPDYHTPGDHADAIKLEGAREVMEFVADVAEALANQEEKIAFVEAGPKVKGSSRGRRGGITLGLMPDVTYEGSDGMPVMFVTEGKPAAVGGVQKGDIILTIEGKAVGNVYDYMSRLDQLKEGMDIVVKVKRNEEEINLLVRI